MSHALGRVRARELAGTMHRAYAQVPVLASKGGHGDLGVKAEGRASYPATG
jgi:hypothetical protein